MLILTRKAGQVICIGEHIRLVITSIVGHNVRIGIQAPPEVKILREELIPLPHNAGEGEI